MRLPKIDPQQLSARVHYWMALILVGLMAGGLAASGGQ
jgi:hypothetical protein